MKKYSNGQLAALLGTSPQTIRNYEKLGLLRTKRGENNYRNYTSADLTMLLYIRLYRNLGFSLGEIQTILRSEDAQILDAFSKKEEELNQIIKQTTKQLAYLRYQKKELEDWLEGNKGIQTVIRPAYRIVLFRKNKDIKEEFFSTKNILDRLTNKMPASRLVMQISKESFESEEYDYSIGLTVTKDVLEEKSELAKHYLDLSPSVCLTFSTNIAHIRKREFLYDNEGFLARTFESEGIREYMCKRKLKLTGDILAFGLHHVIIDNYTAFAWKFFLPIFDDSVVCSNQNTDA